MSTRERRERSNESDRFLRSLFIEALEKTGKSSKGLAIAAVGGYGRGELSPGSDLDILIVHQEQFSIKTLSEFVNALLYPLWDTKSVDHSVRTRSESREAAQSDLKVALGLLDIRLVAGDADLVAEVQSDNLDSWRKNASKRLPELRISLRERHNRAGELAYLLEPDVKEARGGLRDINALRAIALSGVVPVPLERISWAESKLNDVRETLHHTSGRNKDRLLFQEQDAVAKNLEYSDADALMSDVAQAARSVDYLLEFTWHNVERKGKDGLGRFMRKPRTDTVARNLTVSQNEVVIDPLIDISKDPLLGLRAAATAAQLGLPISMSSYSLLSAAFTEGQRLIPEPWPREAREYLISLIGAGENQAKALVRHHVMLGVCVYIYD